MKKSSNDKNVIKWKRKQKKKTFTTFPFFTSEHHGGLKCQEYLLEQVIWNFFDFLVVTQLWMKNLILWLLSYFLKLQFLSDPGLLVRSMCLVSLSTTPSVNLTDVTLADEDTKSILTDKVNRTIQGNLAMQVAPSGDQIRN